MKDNLFLITYKMDISKHPPIHSLDLDLQTNWSNIKCPLIIRFIGRSCLFINWKIMLIHWIADHVHWKIMFIHWMIMLIHWLQIRLIGWSYLFVGWRIRFIACMNGCFIQHHCIFQHDIGGYKTLIDFHQAMCCFEPLLDFD